MQKILFVTDALSLNKSVLDFAAYVCKLSHSKLTAVFLEDTEFETRSESTIREKVIAGGTYAPGVNVDELKRKSCDENIQAFRDACTTHEINGLVHRDRGVPVSEVIKESLFADLILIDAETSFKNGNESTPTKFVKEVLSYAQCPILVMPESFEGIKQLVFTYDGRPSSVFAIKQFTYLFPILSRLPVSLVMVDPEDNLDPEDKYKLNEWLKMHYEQVNTVICDSSVRAGLLEELLYKQAAFIVMGAYGRSAMSTLLRPSHANVILKLITQPLFITHSH